MFVITAVAGDLVAYVGTNGSVRTIEEAHPFETAEDAIAMVKRMEKRRQDDLNNPYIRGLTARQRSMFQQLAPVLKMTVTQV